MDPIIKNRLDLKYEREKKLKQLEKKIRLLGYPIVDIRSNALYEYQKKQVNFP